MPHRRILFVGNLASTHLEHWVKLYRRAGFTDPIDVATFDAKSAWAHGDIISAAGRGPKVFRAALLAVKVFLASRRYVAVHVHSVGWYGVSALLAQAPLIATIYGSEVRAGPPLDPLGWLQSRLFRRATYVHVTSNKMLGAIRERHRLDNLVCIHTGVDLSEIPPPAAPHEGSTVVGHVRSVAKNYRTREIILALGERLKAKPPWSLVIFKGHCDRAYLAECEQLVAKLGVQSSVEFLGFLDRAALGVQLSQMTVALSLPARDQIGASILEALAAGVPVIVTGGDVYEDLRGVPGCYFLDSMEGLSDLVDRVVDLHRGERRCLLPSEYTLDSVAARFSDILEHVVPGHQAAAAR